MKKLTIATLTIAILIGGIYYFTQPKIEYNNSVFTPQRKKELNGITYWVGGKEKNIHPERKMDNVFALLAREPLKKHSHKNSERDGHFSVTLQFEDSVMELGVLDQELTIASDNEKIDGLYEASDDFAGRLSELLE